MTINNYTSTPSSNLKNYFYGKIPFGSEYYIYNESQYVTVMLLRKLGKDEWTEYRATRTQSNSDYTFTERSLSVDSVTVARPYYCYSSSSSCGIKESYANASLLDTLMLVVICCCVVLKTVFGGVRLFRKS